MRRLTSGPFGGFSPLEGRSRRISDGIRTNALPWVTDQRDNEIINKIHMLRNTATGEGLESDNSQTTHSKLAHEQDEDFDFVGPDDAAIYNHAEGVAHDLSIGSGFGNDDVNSHYSSSTVDSEGVEICVRCGSGGNSKFLMQCGVCGGWIHLNCYNIWHNASLSKVPRGLLKCGATLHCSIASIHTSESSLEGEANLATLTESDGAAMSQGSSSRFDDDEGFLPRRPEHGEERMVPLWETIVSLTELRNSQKNTAFTSLKAWSQTLHGLPRGVYNDLITQLSYILTSNEVPLNEQQLAILYKSAPPLDIRRVANRVEARRMHNVVVTQSHSRNIEAFYHLSYYDFADCAIDLCTSPIVRRHGPRRQWSDKIFACSDGLMPRELPGRIAKFAAYNRFDANDQEQEVVPIILFSDESVSKSGNRIVCPVWLTDARLTPDVRAICRENAHSLVTLVPTSSVIDFRFKEKSKQQGSIFDARAHASATEAGLKSEEMAKRLRLKSYAELFTAIAKQERNGTLFSLHGKQIRLRVFLVYFIVDMKERRFILNLKANKWHCMSCYDFPGRPLVGKERKIGKRTLKQDETLRREFAAGMSKVNTVEDVNGKREKLMNKKLKNSEDDDFNRTGIKPVDKCPITAHADEHIIFLEQGPSEIFKSDELHARDGWILRHMKMLQKLLGEESFIAKSMNHGNAYLLTNRYHTHIMERGVESFHFIPFCIMFESSFDSSKIEITPAIRKKIFLGCCNLLAIIGLVVDPCPGYIWKEFEKLVQKYEKDLEYLNKLVTKSGQREFRITTKLHELFCHVPDQILNCGYYPSLSSKIFETLHETVFNLVEHASSGRIVNGLGSKEALQAFNSRLSFRCLNAMDNREPVGMDDKEWSIVPKFEIVEGSETTEKLTWLIETAGNSLGIDVTEVKTSIQFSAKQTVVTKLQMRLVYLKQEVDASLMDFAIVPGTGQPMFTSGGASNAIAYNVTDMETDTHPPWSKCDVEGCSSRSHNKDANLFCSAARDSSTNYCLPVAFDADGVYGIPLTVVEDATGDQIIPVNPAIIECSLGKCVIFIPFGLVRGVSMIKPYICENVQRIFVFRFRRVFRHESL